MQVPTLTPYQSPKSRLFNMTKLSQTLNHKSSITPVNTLKKKKKKIRQDHPKLGTKTKPQPPKSRTNTKKKKKNRAPKFKFQFFQVYRRLFNNQWRRPRVTRATFFGGPKGPKTWPGQLCPDGFSHHFDWRSFLWRLLQRPFEWLCVGGPTINPSKQTKLGTRAKQKKNGGAHRSEPTLLLPQNTVS